VSTLRHEILPDGRTVPGKLNQTITMPTDEIRIARIELTKLTKAMRREMGAWLSSNLGRPDRNSGLWWANEDGHHLLVCFRNDEAFVNFSLKYC
jgi:hypothetical protein